ncbi:unnamed protein product [Cercospora beticola]|nr:unnamed protein product [Cercospora beticola]
MSQTATLALRIGETRRRHSTIDLQNNTLRPVVSEEPESDVTSWSKGDDNMSIEECSGLGTSGLDALGMAENLAILCHTQTFTQMQQTPSTAAQGRIRSHHCRRWF